VGTLDSDDIGDGDTKTLCNVEKTVCMVFPPMDRRKAVMSVFPCFELNDRVEIC